LQDVIAQAIGGGADIGVGQHRKKGEKGRRGVQKLGAVRTCLVSDCGGFGLYLINKTCIFRVYTAAAQSLA
jgi:hypothetical protein